jgi:Ca2+-binding EF-hand superfamily protein
MCSKHTTPHHVTPYSTTARRDIAPHLHCRSAAQVAFARVDTEDRGEIPHEEMGAAFSQVGMDPSQEDIAAVLAHLGKDADPSPTFTFAEFAQAADFLSPVS